jgi:hypothetical protein
VATKVVVDVVQKAYSAGYKCNIEELHGYLFSNPQGADSVLMPFYQRE